MIDDPFDPPGNDRIGGGHIFLFDIGRFLVRIGFNVTYIIRKNSPNKNTLEKLGEKCQVIRLQVGPEEEIEPQEVSKLILPLEREFSNTVRKLRNSPSVIHSVYWISGIVALDYSKTNHTKHVHSILSLGRLKTINKLNLTVDDKIRDDAEIKLFNSVNDLILVCPNELQSLKRLYPEVNNKNCHIIPYGIDENIFFPRPESTANYVRRAAKRF